MSEKAAMIKRLIAGLCILPIVLLQGVVRAQAADKLAPPSKVSDIANTLNNSDYDFSDSHGFDSNETEDYSDEEVLRIFKQAHPADIYEALEVAGFDKKAISSQFIFDLGNSYSIDSLIEKFESFPSAFTRGSGNLGEDVFRVLNTVIDLDKRRKFYETLRDEMEEIFRRERPETMAVISQLLPQRHGQETKAGDQEFDFKKGALAEYGIYFDKVVTSLIQNIHFSVPPENAIPETIQELMQPDSDALRVALRALRSFYEQSSIDPSAMSFTEKAAKCFAFDCYHKVIHNIREDNNAIPKLPESPLAGTVALDVGSGVNFAAQAGFTRPATPYIAVDRSLFMVIFLREMNKLLRIKNVTVVHSDIKKLERPRMKLGLVRAKNVTTYMADIGEKWREILGWLEPGGWLYIQYDQGNALQAQGVVEDWQPLVKELIGSGWRFEFKLNDVGLDTLVLTKPGPVPFKGAGTTWEHYVASIAGLHVDDIFDRDVALKWYGPLAFERKISPYEKVFSFYDKAFLVWTEGPKAGRIYRIVSRPPQSRLSKLLTMKKIVGAIDKRLAELAKIDALKSKQYVLDAMKNAELCLYLRQLYDGNIQTIGLKEAQLFDGKGQYAAFLEGVQKKGLKSWLEERARSLGYKDVRTGDGGMGDVGEQKLLFPYYFGAAKHDARLYFDPKDPIELVHKTYSNVLTNIIQMDALASKDYFEKMGIKKRFGGERGGQESKTPHYVSFWPVSTTPAFFYGSYCHEYSWMKGIGFELPMELGITRSKARTLGLRAGSLEGEEVVPRSVALKDITHIFVPSFAIAEVQEILRDHGYATIKVAPLGAYTASSSRRKNVQRDLDRNTELDFAA